MSGGFAVKFSAQALEDVERLVEFALLQATTLAELQQVEEARDEIFAAASALERSPFLYRKVENDPLLRELLVPVRRTGYVLLYRIIDSERVSILAVRHQLEDDYH